jgi:hypothetical protein
MVERGYIGPDNGQYVGPSKHIHSNIRTFIYEGSFIQEEVAFPAYLKFCTVGTNSINQSLRITRVESDGKATTIGKEWYVTSPESITYHTQHHHFNERAMSPYFIKTNTHSTTTREEFHRLWSEISQAVTGALL